MKKRITAAVIEILFCLLVASIAYIPLLNGSVPMGSDTSFHINRIEALYTAYEAGELFPGVFWNMNYGYGYGSPLFYSCFFLYIPVMFRHWGMDMIPAYRLFLFLIYFFTAFTMYNLARKVLRKHNAAVFLTVLLYEFSMYVYSDTINRGAVGEALAYIFIPVIIQGLWSIFYNNGKGWTHLTVGLACLLLSHNISFFMMCIIIVIYCLTHVLDLIHKPIKILYLALAALLAFGCTLWFSLPMLEQLQEGCYRVSTYFNDISVLDGTGVNLEDFFCIIPYDISHVGTCVGLVLMVLPAFVFFIKRKKRFFKEMAVIGYFTLFMTTAIFPWTWFPFMSFLQFPHRLFTICSSFLAIASGYTFAYLPVKKIYRKRIRLVIAVYSLVIVFMQVGVQFSYTGVFFDYTTPEDIQSTDGYWEGRDDWYNLMELSTPDYLPSDKITNYHHDTRTIIHEDMADSVFEEDDTSMQWGYDGGGIYIYPKTWYKGYAVNVEKDGTVLCTVDTEMDEETGNVTFTLPDGLDENAKVVLYYAGTPLRNTCFKISKAVFLLTVICYGVLKSLIVYASLHSSNANKAAPRAPQI